MKNRINGFGRTFTAVLVTLCMLFSIFAPTVMAANDVLSGYSENVNETDKNYVSLGDSMTNGYGLPGYDGNTGVEDYGNGSYANLFAEWLKNQPGIGNVNHAQLAMSAMRAEDLHWLLEFDYTDDEAIALTDAKPEDDGYDDARLWWEEVHESRWNAKFSTGDFWTWYELCDDYRFSTAATYILAMQGDEDAIEALKADPEAEVTTGEAAIVAEYYQTAVREANIISLGIGNGNFGVFMFGRVMEAIGFDGEPSDALIYNVENAIRECDPEMQAEIVKLIDELYVTLEEVVVSLAGDAALEADTVDALINTMVYTGVGFALNYAGSLEAILQLNSDAEIIQVALMNTFASEAEVLEITFGDLLDAVYTPLNAFIAALPTYMQATENSVYADAKFYYAEADNVKCLVDTYAVEFNALVRDRFIKDIVGTCDCSSYCYDVTCPTYDPGMVWELLIPMIGDLAPGGTLLRPGIEDLVVYNGLTTEQKVGFLVSGDTDAVISCELYFAFEDAIVSASAGTPITIDSVLGLGAGISFDNVMANFSANAGTNAAGYVSEVIAILAEAYERDVSDVEYLYDNNVDGMQDMINGICSCLVIRGTLATALQSDPSIAGLLGLFARCVIGNGLGSHPSVAGHEALGEAVIEAYSTGYTSQDKTCENAVSAIETAYNLILEYYDEAYAYGYKYAKENGYVDVVAKAVQEAIEAVEAAKGEVAGLGLSAELVAEINKELDEVAGTLAEIKDAIATDKMATVEALAAVVKNLEDDLWAHLNNAKSILEAAGSDAVELLIEKWENEWKYEVEELLKVLAEESAEFLVEVVKTYAPVLAEYAYNFLLESPEKVIEFITTYGPYVIEVIDEYGAEIVSVIGYFLVNYGVDAVIFVVENGEEVLGALSYLVSEFGDEAWALVEVYAEALGITAELQGAFDAAENCILGQIAALAGQLETLKAELEELRAELVGKVDALQEKINEKIELIEAKIAELEAMIETLKEQLAKIVAELEEAIEELAKVADAIVAVVEMIKAGEGDLMAALENVKAAIENFIDTVVNSEEIIKSLEALAEGLNNMASEKLSAAVEFIEEKLAELENVINAAIESIEEELAALKEKVDEAVAELVVKLEELAAELEELKAELEVLGAALAEKAEQVIEEAKVAAAKLAAAVEEAKAMVEAFIAEVMAKLEAALRADYLLDPVNSYYVALGDKTTVGEGDDSYADILASLIGLGENKYNDLTRLGSSIFTAEDLAALLANEDIKEEIEKADLITVGYNNKAVYDLIVSMTGGKVADWAELFGEEVEEAVEKALAYVQAELEAYVAEELGAEAEAFVEIIINIVEVYAYAYVARAVSIHEVVDLLHEVTPEALVVIVGSYNDFEGAVIDDELFALMGMETEGVTVELGEYIGYVVDALNTSSFLGAVLNENTIYVSAEEVETQLEADSEGEIGLMQFVTALMSNDLLPSAAGNSYIAEQIYAALNVIESSHEHKYDSRCDRTCNTCGEEREVGPHTYYNACDATCNICGEEREVAGHQYDADCDAICNVCGEKREAAAHSFGNWVVSRESTVNLMGEQYRKCTKCGEVERQLLPVVVVEAEDEGLSTGAVVTIVTVPSLLALAAGGFGIFWFAYKKKTWKDLTTTVAKFFASFAKK